MSGRRLKKRGPFCKKDKIQPNKRLPKQVGQYEEKNKCTVGNIRTKRGNKAERRLYRKGLLGDGKGERRCSTV